MTVVYCVDFYYPHIGGGELLLQSLAERMAINHVVHVVTQRHEQSLAVNETLNGVHIHRVKCSSRVDFTWRALPTLWRLVRSSDLIHTATFAAAFPAFLVGRWHNKPTMITIYEIFGTLWFTFLPFLPAIFSYYGEKILLGLPFSEIITPSRYTTNSLRLTSRAFALKRITTIYCGIDSEIWGRPKSFPNHLIPLLSSQHQLLFWGRCGTSKGLEHLVNAVSFLPHDISLLAITPSNDPRLAKIIEQVADLGLKKRVKFHDSLPVRDLVALASRVDAVVVPSIVEGFGFVAAEASRVAKRLIVSDGGSLPETASGNVVFVSPMNPHSIAEGIKLALADHFTRIAPKDFSWQKSVSAHLEVYERWTKNE